MLDKRTNNNIFDTVGYKILYRVTDQIQIYNQAQGILI